MIPLDKAQAEPRSRTPARNEEHELEQTGEESLGAHALRVLRTRVCRAVANLLRPVIGALQVMLQRVDPEPEPEERSERRSERRGSSAGRGRDSEPDAEPEAPESHRLRRFLLYLLIFVLGGLGGGALAYPMFERMLEKRTAEAQRLESTMSKQTKSADTSKKRLEEAQAKLAELEKKPAEAEVKLAETEKKLAQEQAKRSELETQLKTLQSNHSKALTDQQKKLAEAVKLLDSIRGIDTAARPAAAPLAPRPQKTGDCTVGSSSVSSLKDCVDNFNR